MSGCPLLGLILGVVSEVKTSVYHPVSVHDYELIMHVKSSINHETAAETLRLLLMKLYISFNASALGYVGPTLRPFGGVQSTEILAK